MLTALKAVRAFCLQCCGDQPSEVRACTSVSCPLHHLRFGKYPHIVIEQCQEEGENLFTKTVVKESIKRNQTRVRRTNKRNG